MYVCLSMHNKNTYIFKYVYVFVFVSVYAL